MNSFFRITGFCVALVNLAAVCTPTRATAAEQPDILLIMADDIGIEGLGCYGGTSYRTPHLDRLAAGGLRFTRAYAQPLCTPTRVEIMTGRYNHRNWRAFGILDPSERTFGHYLKEAGYATGIFGKWQLQSYDPPDYPGAAQRRGTGMHPKDAGFDRYALFHALHTEDKGSRYANPVMLEGTAGNAGKLHTYPGRYGEDVWVEKIVRFFDDTRDQPTFVYYPMALPHRPFEPTPQSADWDPDNVPPEDVRYIRDMVEYMDTAVGRLIEQLRQRKLLDNTLVLFYADNGFHRAVTSDLADGRTIQGGKGETLQTAIHVPLIASWPGHIDAGVCEDLVDASDFVPTLLDVAQAKRPHVKLDGISFAPRLLGTRPAPRETAFFWYDPRPGWDKERFYRSVFAVNADYKLFQTGRLFRLGPRPLEETAVDILNQSEADKKARDQLATVIQQHLRDGQPPLVDAWGRPEIDLTVVPPDRKAADAVADQLLRTAKKVAYGTEPDQRMWIFEPLSAVRKDDLRACVFFIHGGGWNGHPRMLAPQAAWLQRRGYTTVSVHFRPPRNGNTPHDCLKDVRAAYRWVQKNGRKFHIDPQRIVASGGSAGGHLSLAMVTIDLPDDPRLAEDGPVGLVLFNPVIDLVDGWEAGRKRCLSLGISPDEFSPAHHVHPQLPPTLILSGSNDPLIPPKLIRAFCDRMHKAGNNCRFIEYPGEGHGFFNFGRKNNTWFYHTNHVFEDFLRDITPLNITAER